MNDHDRYDVDREEMVNNQIKRRGIKDPRVLEAMRTVPRHKFVPVEYRHVAYTDGPLKIGEGQTISQPYIVALMTELLSLDGDERVLEIGTGSGYQAAVLAEVAAEVHTIERHPSLARKAGKVLEELGYTNITIHLGDGTMGVPDEAPFDAIITTAGAPETPKTLLNQLSDGGVMVLPVGGRYSQNLERWTRDGDSFHKKVLTPVAFVPLVGEEGWDEDKSGFLGL
ncbi:MAG: protein-L-isoaspartate(D-aspartate) O-methyltransferase [Gammaproteobacteria bacterium]|nr:protein-L-isoaspartate(D-aspartate) O-methyltransferase [Gammaproteobacteria bacterium]